MVKSTKTPTLAERLEARRPRGRSELHDRISRSDKGAVGALVIALDQSTSMEGNKLQQAIAGTRGLAREAIAKGYSVSVVGFASSARIIVEPTIDVELVATAIRNLNASGSTDMASALERGIETLSAFIGRQRIICLVTDGVPDDQPATLQTAEKCKDCRIDIMAIGTDDADLAFLRLLATRAGLSVSVESVRLADGIASMAKLLPR